jgi:hypothetical protein
VLSERLRRAQDQNVQAEMELEALRQARARLQRLLAQVGPRPSPAGCPSSASCPFPAACPQRAGALRRRCGVAGCRAHAAVRSCVGASAAHGL